MAEDGRESGLVIGVGNPDRGDDGAGPRVAALLRAQGMRAIDHAGDGLTLIELWKDHCRVLIVDAMTTGAGPGTVKRFDAVAEPLPRDAFAVSSHAFGLAEGVEMARRLGRLPAEVTVFGIEGASYSLGAGLSGNVEQACREVARHILVEMNGGQGTSDRSFGRARKGDGVAL